MFSIGEKIVYPMYGAGVVEGVEEKEIDGVNEKYYIINIPYGNLKIRVSAKKAETVGLRKIYDGSYVINVMKSVSDMPIITIENWNQRYKENMEKIKTGNFSEVALVVRNLILREKDRGLSGAEKKMLNSAKQIILSEIVFSQNIEKDKAEELLAKSLLGC